jgi:hypothetical protein
MLHNLAQRGIASSHGVNYFFRVDDNYFSRSGCLTTVIWSPFFTRSS